MQCQQTIKVVRNGKQRHDIPDLSPPDGDDRQQRYNHDNRDEPFKHPWQGDWSVSVCGNELSFHRLVCVWNKALQLLSKTIKAPPEQWASACTLYLQRSVLHRVLALHTIAALFIRLRNHACFVSFEWHLWVSCASVDTRSHSAAFVLSLSPGWSGRGSPVRPRMRDEGRPGSCSPFLLLSSLVLWD